MNEPPKKVTDEMNNHYILSVKPLGEGGQGAVYRCNDNPEIAIKIINSQDIEKTQRTLKKLKSLPIPLKAHFATPIYLLKEKNGYIMNLVRSMTEISSLMYCRDDKKNILEFYKETGGLLRRLKILHQAAYHLNMMHSVPLVYGDISPNNIFISEKTKNYETWFIDGDNLNFADDDSCGYVYTPMYGAPELATGQQKHSLYSDVYSFAIIAYQLLSLNHPFEGGKVLGLVDGAGWDDEDIAGDGDLYGQIEKGEMPWGLSEEDESNSFLENVGIPPQLFLTDNLYYMFERGFSEAGRKRPMTRPSMRLWLFALLEIIGKVVQCECGWNYIVESRKDFCPYCEKSSEQVYLLERYRNSELQSIMTFNETRVNIPLPYLEPTFDYKQKGGEILVEDSYIRINLESCIENRYIFNRDELIIEMNRLPHIIKLTPKESKNIPLELHIKELI